MRPDLGKRRSMHPDCCEPPRCPLLQATRAMSGNLLLHLRLAEGSPALGSADKRIRQKNSCTRRDHGNERAFSVGEWNRRLAPFEQRNATRHQQRNRSTPASSRTRMAWAAGQFHAGSVAVCASILACRFTARRSSERITIESPTTSRADRCPERMA